MDGSNFIIMPFGLINHINAFSIFLKTTTFVDLKVEDIPDKNRDRLLNPLAFKRYRLRDLRVEDIGVEPMTS